MKKSVVSKLFLFWVTVIVAACNNPEPQAGDSTAQGMLYADCRIEGGEDKENVTCLLQFRSERNGRAVLLEEPLKIALDGETIPPDSARLSGVFYELAKPRNEFIGKHTLIFTDAEGKRHKEEFEFFPFSLEDAIPEKVKKEPFIIKLKNFPLRPTSVQLVLVDTAFETNDINEIAVITKARLHISESMLKHLKSGPLFFELSREEERSFKKGSKWRGRIVVSYGLKREFELVD